MATTMASIISFDRFNCENSFEGSNEESILRFFWNGKKININSSNNG
jgi:hypothetical protein